MPKTPVAILPEHFFNRELSWLAFNDRVLAEAERMTLPVLERAKFLAITASNLDEFFMVRVGGLQLQREKGLRTRDDAGLTPTQQLDLIKERVEDFLARQYAIYNNKLLPELHLNGIRRLKPQDLTPQQRTTLQAYHDEHIEPVLSPVEINPASPPNIPALQLVLIAHIGSAVRNQEPDRFVIITLPTILPRYISVTDVDPGVHAFVTLEDLITLHLHQFFPGEQVIGTARFRMSRNSDIAVDEGGSDDLATEMEEVLDARRSSPTIRIEIEQGASRALERVIRDLCGRASKPHIFTMAGELDLRALWALVGLSGFEDLKVANWESQPSPAVESGMSMFDVIKKKDLMLHHPFESFDPVLQFIEEAAGDPDVVAIKQILYRTAKNSRIINALIKAAEAGKHVTVLVELKARFDEARNLERAEDLINAGAQIIYGVRGLKTHAKILLVMRREAGHMMRYMHFGTGNYNEATSKLYTDISYLTCRPDCGSDASAFFNTVTGRSRFQHFERLSMAPYGLRERVLGLIASEIDRARSGEPAEITLKMNSLEDHETILALYKASQAGVKIRLNVRGICCLRPGVPGVSENIRVVSIIDRYLEHARIFCFRQGGSPSVFIASADFMNRNLSKRVELLVPIEDNAARKRLVAILDTHFADNTQAYVLGEDGRYRLSVEDSQPLRSQEVFAKEATKRAKQAAHSPDLLVPHLPKVESA